MYNTIYNYIVISNIEYKVGCILLFVIVNYICRLTSTKNGEYVTNWLANNVCELNIYRIMFFTSEYVSWTKFKDKRIIYISIQDLDIQFIIQYSQVTI